MATMWQESLDEVVGSIQLWDLQRDISCGMRRSELLPMVTVRRHASLLTSPDASAPTLRLPPKRHRPRYPRPATATPFP